MKTFEEKIDAFTEFLHNAAKERGMIFIEEAGDGHDLLTDEMYLEDVAGWLCPIGTPEDEQKDEKWFVIAEWEMIDGEPVIKFVKYD